MITSYYSFKVLVHDVKLQITEPIILQKARLSIILANFPKLYIAANRGISTLTPDVKCFNHGKQVQLQINHDQLKEILLTHPLEIILINNTKFLAGAKIKLTSFLPDIEKQGDFRFRRGTFHLLDPTGQSFAVADLSLCFHPQIEKPIVEEQLTQLNQVKIVSKKPSSDQYEPPPEDITYNPPNNTGKRKDLRIDSVKENQNQNYHQQLLTFGFKNQFNLQVKEQEQNESQQQQSNILTHQSYTVDQTQITRKLKKQKEPPKDKQSISIIEWVNGYHCPPPMILDKKNPHIEQPKQVVNHFGKLIQQESVAVQTENILFEQPQPAQIVAANYKKIQQKNSFESQRRSIANDKQDIEVKSNRMKTGQSDEYYNDEFESFEQSQQLGNQNRQKSGENKLSENNLKKSNSIVIGEEDDKVSEIYSEDFELMSQSQSISMKRSQSMERLGKGKKQSIEGISESYIPDFESVSQSQSTSQVNSYNRYRKK